jgi:hypothetical protein
MIKIGQRKRYDTLRRTIIGTRIEIFEQSVSIVGAEFEVTAFKNIVELLQTDINVAKLKL